MEVNLEQLLFFFTLIMITGADYLLIKTYNIIAQYNII